MTVVMIQPNANLFNFMTIMPRRWTWINLSLLIQLTFPQLKLKVKLFRSCIVRINRIKMTQDWY